MNIVHVIIIGEDGVNWPPG